MRKISFSSSKILVILGTFSLVLAFSFSRPSKLDSANLIQVKDTLQSSRLSINARVGVGVSAGGSRVLLKTSASAPANTISTANLGVGTSLTIGTGAYTVTGIIDADEFSVTPVLAAGDSDEDDVIYFKSKPRHVVTFITTTAVPDGYFRVLLPADGTNPNDQAPDDEGFDFNSGVDVVASDIGNYDFVTGVATASGGAGCTSPANYHCFEVHYSGNGGIGTTITINIGNTNGTNTPIAPATGTAHTEATADTYTFQVKNYSATDAQIDATSGKIAFIENVRVTATVDPSISFSIAGIGTGTSICGTTPSIDTSTGTNAPLAVPFGSLTLNTFKTAGHNLTVSTNAASGYVVTAAENDQLGKDGATTPLIVDTPCDAGPCTHTSAQEWVTATNNGFGYSIQNIDAASAAFEYSGGTWLAKQFADLSASEVPQTLFSSTTVANAENAYVCYRISIGATQTAGDYENQITYTATGTF
ncbi:MAG: hypothetical protein ABII80_03235 [bacterium]